MDRIKLLTPTCLQGKDVVLAFFINRNIANILNYCATLALPR
tara:strand:+ start:3044 stop:3169 length:126 start_codon:yes stop_codon:yes gene_type:complete